MVILEYKISRVSFKPQKTSSEMHHGNCIMRVHKYQLCTLLFDPQDHCSIWSSISHILVEIICKKSEVGVKQRTLSVSILKAPPSHHHQLSTFPISYYISLKKV